MSEEATRTLPIDARVVALDETRYYSIDEQDKPYIKEIRAMYMYDKNEVTHCCELTPSYWLVHLYNQVITTDDGGELPEEHKGRLYEKYEHEPSDDIYVHCRVVDSIENRAVEAGKETPRLYGRLLSGDYYVHGDTGVSYEETPYDDQMEALREHFCGNCPL